jgi:hypothetical protein
MQRLMVFIGLSLMAGQVISAQEAVDFNTLNTETYRLYLAQEWDSVIRLGKQGLRLDMDFYYLRMRMGIASYEKHRYRTASRHFSAALEQNQGDPVALEYLYYSRLLSGQTEQAGITRAQFRGELAQKLPPQPARFFEQLSLESLYSTGVDDQLFEDPAGLYPLDTPGDQSTTRYFANTTLILVNRISPGFRLSHTLTFLSKSNHFFTGDGSGGVYMEDQRVRQLQYYFSPEFTLRSGTHFSPMIHILGIRSQVPYDSGMGYMGGSSQMGLGTLKQTGLVTGLGFSQAAGSLDLHLGTYYSSLNGLKQFHGRAGFTWYPLGNLNLYAGAYVNSQFELDRETAGPVRFIPEALFGFAIAEKVWFETRGSLGDMSNFLEYNGRVVYNSYTEVMEKKINLTLSVPVTESGSLLYLGGRWTANRSVFTPTYPDIGGAGNDIHYNAISIYGGVLWKF